MVIKVTALAVSDGFGVAVAAAPEVVADYLNVVPAEVDYLVSAREAGLPTAEAAVDLLAKSKRYLEDPVLGLRSISVDIPMYPRLIF